MNRLVIIGNGFDLAHGLKTRYEDFINWYWEQRVMGFNDNSKAISKDCLCEFRIEAPYSWSHFYCHIKNISNIICGKDVVRRILAHDYGVKMSHSFSPFFDSIIKSVETKGWVDIENEYYHLLTKYAINEPSPTELSDLNAQLQYIQDLLAKYLIEESKKETTPDKGLLNKFYAPIKPQDISVERSIWFQEYIDSCKRQSLDVWRQKQTRYGLNDLSVDRVERYVQTSDRVYYAEYPDLFMLPDNIQFVNFNYTNTVDFYLRRNVSSQIHIHGDLEHPQNIIFGYGDEMDKNFPQLQNLNDNECLRKIKSIKYLESDNYRNVLRFIDSSPYQIYIMGHSCGNSDRTLLNTLFEHKNCISIKPYFYQKADGTDNYLDIVQNISRNFTDMKLMRDRIVNRTFCETIM